MKRWVTVPAEVDSMQVTMVFKPAPLPRYELAAGFDTMCPSCHIYSTVEHLVAGQEGQGAGGTEQSIPQMAAAEFEVQAGVSHRGAGSKEDCLSRRG